MSPPDESLKITTKRRKASRNTAKEIETMKIFFKTKSNKKGISYQLKIEDNKQPQLGFGVLSNEEEKRAITVTYKKLCEIENQFLINSLD